MILLPNISINHFYLYIFNMQESIKEVYENINKIITTSLNNLLLRAFNNDIIKYTELNIKNNIFTCYPSLNFNLILDFDQFNKTLNCDFNMSSDWFDMITSKNYTTHNFLLSKNRIYKLHGYKHLDVLSCEKCNLSITVDGRIIDGDYSCNEYIIKNIIE